MWHVVFVTLGLLAARPISALDKKYDITIGYLPCINGFIHDKQGMSISGALSMALEEINDSKDLLPDVKLSLMWNDTRCDTAAATRVFSEMARSGVVAVFGPEGRCYTKDIIDNSRNLPVISYRCSDYRTSMLSNFARLEPSYAQATKSVISLLRYYRWRKFSILYEETWEMAALTLENHAKKNNMTVNHRRPFVDAYKCCQEKMACCAPGHKYWDQIIQETKNRSRIYVVLGTTSSLRDMMSTMESLQLFAKGEYMVIFVDPMAYSAEDSLKYLLEAKVRTDLHVCPKTDGEFEKRARSLLVVVVSEPDSSYATFARRVREYNTKKPFSIQIPAIFGNIYNQFVSIYAAYLYDSVKLYATALNDLIEEETTYKNDILDREKLMSIASNGSRIVSKMIAITPFKSITGTTFYLDEQANSEGNFSVLAFENIAVKDSNCNASMYPVGHFRQQRGKEYPEYKLNPYVPINWPDGVKPDDEPSSSGLLNGKYPKHNSQTTTLVLVGLAITLLCALVITIKMFIKNKNKRRLVA